MDVRGRAHGEDLDDLEVVKSWEEANERLSETESGAARESIQRDEEPDNGQPVVEHAGQQTDSQAAEEAIETTATPEGEPPRRQSTFGERSESAGAVVESMEDDERIMTTPSFTPDQLETLHDRFGDIGDLSSEEFGDLLFEDVETADQAEGFIQQMSED